jgi:hypothetical protein
VEGIADAGVRVLPQSNAYNPVADRASWWGLRGVLLEKFGLTNTTDPYTAFGNTYDYDTGFAGIQAGS